MKSTEPTTIRPQLIPAVPVSWPRVSLDSGATLSWTGGNRLDIPAALALARRGPVSVSHPPAEALDSLPRTLPPLLAAFGVCPSQVELSFTAHRVACGGVDTLLALSSLRDIGLNLSLVGLRSHQLCLLSRIPLTTVILDPGLIACLPGCRDALDEVRDMAIAAQTLGLGTVAAGIETDAQRLLLIQMGITMGEGELFTPR